MNTPQLAAYMRLLELGKSKLPRTDNKAADDHIYLRGFNAGIVFAEEMLVKAMAPAEIEPMTREQVEEISRRST